MRAIFIIIIVVFYLSACHGGVRDSNRHDDVCFLSNGIERYIKVSINDDLLKLKDGGKYAIEGYLASTFEDGAIYQGKSIYAKGYSLNYAKEIEQRYSLIEQLNGKKVLVYGTLNLKKHGHLNSYFGVIDSVFCIKMIR